MEIETTIPILGKAGIGSPIGNKARGEQGPGFTSDHKRILAQVDVQWLEKFMANGQTPPSFEAAGPREQIYFDPSKLRCALVTCGGLCPGLNNIIRSVVMELYYGYGVNTIYGIRYGLRGFIADYGHAVMNLTPDKISDIHQLGGSILGSSRGPQSVEAIADCLERMNIGILFIVGGDGSMVAATKISDAISRRKLKISVVGIPKTIDNDIYLISQSFGFDTAVDVATHAIRAAHNEAQGYPNGIGLIKLMGRHSGFIAATAALAQQDVNFVLIPEVDFDLDGPDGLLASVEKRLEARGHSVIVVAEGAGQKFFNCQTDAACTDASGNIRLSDIGGYLKERLKSYFQQRQIDISIKYIDPSYMIRSLPANANDHVFCNFLGRDAVHAAMAGKTRLIVGYLHNHFVHIPMAASVGKRKHVDPHDRLWRSVLEATGQPLLKNQS